MEYTAAGFITTMIPLACSDKQVPVDGNLSQPNVLLVTLDTTRTERLSCYGYHKQTSPNLDLLAGQGIQFDMAIATSGATPMAHASVMTGLNNYQHGLRVIYAKSGCKLPDSVPTLASIMKNAGRETAGFISSFTVSEFYGLNQGFDLFNTWQRRELGDSIFEKKSRRPIWMGHA